MAHLEEVAAILGLSLDSLTMPPASQLQPGYKPAVKGSPDLDRIIALPRRMPIAEDSPEALQLIDLVTTHFGRRNDACVCRSEFKRDCIRQPRAIQAWTLYECARYHGVVGSIGVGHGKTFLDILAPLAVPNVRHAVLLVPSNLVGQLWRDYQLISQHFRVPEIVSHGSIEFRAEVPGAPVLHVMPYAKLSRAEQTDFLDQIQPDLIIADETHKLRDPKGAGAGRVMRYFLHHGGCRFLVWSGSLTSASLKDYSHLSAISLRVNSPLPLDPETVAEWAQAIDPSPTGFVAPPGELRRLCANPAESVDRAFARRLHDTPGFVHTSTSPVKAKLVLKERTAPPIPEEVAAALNELRATGFRPDGELLNDPMAIWRCAVQLACGFYYRWEYPNHEPELLIESWLEARTAWHKDVREKLKEKAVYLDSPLLCARAAARAAGDGTLTELDDTGHEVTEIVKYDPCDPKLPVWHSEHWGRWRDMRPLVRPVTKAVRLNPYLANDAAEWGLSNRGIIWYEHSEFARWVSELSGLPVHGGGPDAGERIGAETGNRSIIASIKSHGTGRDGLQLHFSNQLVANPMASASGWEQLLGRLHRIGQRADSVYGWYYGHTEELRKSIETALVRAAYIETTMGATQKLQALR